MRGWMAFGLAVVVALAASWTAAAAAGEPAVWSVDHVKAKPGEYDNYRRFLEANWVPAREEALKRGHIESYRLLAQPQDDATAFDFVLLTRYPSQGMYDRREALFTEVFQAIRGDRGPTLIDGKGSRDLADIVLTRAFTEHAGAP